LQVPSFMVDHRVACDGDNGRALFGWCRTGQLPGLTHRASRSRYAAITRL